MLLNSLERRRAIAGLNTRVCPHLRGVSAALGHPLRSWDSMKHPAVRRAGEDGEEEAGGWIESTLSGPQMYKFRVKVQIQLRREGRAEGCWCCGCNLCSTGIREGHSPAETWTPRSRAPATTRDMELWASLFTSFAVEKVTKVARECAQGHAACCAQLPRWQTVRHLS